MSYYKKLMGSEGKILKESYEEAFENSITVNCHGYACAVSEVPGLPAGWLLGLPCPYTADINPERVILNKFFTLIKSFNNTRSVFKAASELRSGDLVTFLDLKGNNVHSGIIVDSPSGRMMIRSKIGLGPTIEIPFRKMRRVYKFSSIEVWRRNSEANEKAI